MILGLLALSSALTQQPLGYPIFVRKAERGCEFVIQDMVMLHRSDVRDWMKDLPDKERRIDLIWSGKADQGCLRVAKSIVREAGFSNVAALKDDEARDYSSGLPPE
jgi:hypothetical protein